MNPASKSRGRIQTVRGLIEPEQLGPTLIHEHVLCDLTPPSLANSEEREVEITLENVWEIQYHWVKHLGNSRLNEEGVAVQELRRMGKAGGRSIVELSNVGTKRNPQGLLRVSEAAEMNIIMGCGYYIEEFLTPEVCDKTVEMLTREIISDIVEGVGETGIKAGIIGEMGCSHPWTVFEKRALHAAVLAQQETGATITVHPGRHPDAPYKIVRFIQEAGGDPARTIICHIERTIFDKRRLLRLVDTGCVLEFDFFGIESSYYPFQQIDLPNDGMRLNVIRTLIDKGHLSRILISHDICTKTRLAYYGGHGYSHIFMNVIPMMIRKGFSDIEIDTLLNKNPCRLLTFV